MTARHFLDLSDAGGNAIAAMLGDAIDRKAARKDWPKGRADADAPLAGRVLALVFEKSSTRTRVSFDMAMRQLGGSALILDAGTSQLGRGESIADTARVLSRMADAIMVRTSDHAKILEMARHASVPVINGLTDRSHPCQIVADLLTMIEHKKPLPGLEVAWFGDGNNVLHSILEAAALMKFNVRIATPAGYEPEAEFVDMARAAGCAVMLTQDAAAAANGADVVVTDTWVSMGQDRFGGKARRDGALSRRYRADGAGKARRGVSPLPARACGRRSERGSVRRPAVGGVRRGGEPNPRAEVRAAVVLRLARMKALPIFAA